MMKRIYLFFLSVSFLITGCDYLDMVPEDDIKTVETVFEQRKDAEKWLLGTYTATKDLATNVAKNVAYFGTDEVTTGEYIRNRGYGGFKISEGLQMSQEPYGNVWDNVGSSSGLLYYQILRNINIFIENIDAVYNMTDVEKRQWKAEAKALKAYVYFDLVRHYGPIVLVPKNLSVDIDMSELRQQRVHVDTCFNALVRLCDEAAKDLLLGNQKPFDRKPFFSKEATLALKARALLYAASPLFNGNEFYSDFLDKEGKPLFSTSYDHEKWHLAALAADEAVRVAVEAGHALCSGTISNHSEVLNHMEDIEKSVISDFDNQEFILEWKSVAGFSELLLPRLRPEDTEHFNSAVLGSLSPSLKMVEMYYTDKGLPIDMDKTWNYSSRYYMGMESDPDYTDIVLTNADVLQLHLRREPRFYACIAADRTKWQRGPKGQEINYNLTVEAYKGESFGSQYDIVSSTVAQNINGYWWKKFLESELTTKEYVVSANRTLPIIRLAVLYLMQAEAWYEYFEKPDARVYSALNKVRERAGIPDVVTAWKSYSNNPEKVDNRDGMRDIIQREINLEFALEGHRFWNLRRWKTAHIELNEKQYGWNVLGENAQAFYNDYNGPVIVWSKCKFTAPRDYLFPIKAEEVLMSSLVQNPGW